MPTVCHHLAGGGRGGSATSMGPVYDHDGGTGPTRVCVCAVFWCGGGAELVAGIAGIFRGEQQN